MRLTNGVLTAAFREGARYPGLYSEIWEVKTSDSEIPFLKVPVSARVTGGLAVTPSKIDLPRSGDACTRQVLIRAAEGRDGTRPSRLTVLSAKTKPRK